MEKISPQWDVQVVLDALARANYSQSKRRPSPWSFSSDPLVFPRGTCNHTLLDLGGACNTYLHQSNC